MLISITILQSIMDFLNKNRNLLIFVKNRCENPRENVFQVFFSKITPEEHRVVRTSREQVRGSKDRQEIRSSVESRMLEGKGFPRESLQQSLLGRNAHFPIFD